MITTISFCQLWQPLVLGSALCGVLACSGDTTGPPPVSPSHAYWALQLNQHAVNLALQAPYNTIQLTATPLTETGTPVPGGGPVTFQASDSNVTVSSGGVVTAHFVTAMTQVIASLAVQGVTLKDTVYLQVTEAAPQHPLATFSLQPAPGDSAKRAVDIIRTNNGLTWPVTATDLTGLTICNSVECPLLIRYTTSNPAVATIDSTTGLVRATDTGHVVFTATTWAYGVAKRDSVVFFVGYKLHFLNQINVVLPGSATSVFSAPRKLVLGVGGVLEFWNQSRDPVGVVFDDTTAVDSTSDSNPVTGDQILIHGTGNVSRFGGDTTGNSGYLCVHMIYCFTSDSDFTARRFRKPHTYHYHSTQFPSEIYELDVR